MTLTETILSHVQACIDSEDGPTVYQVAKAANIQQTKLKQYLDGEKIPRADTLDRLAEWLGAEVKIKPKKSK